MGLRPKQLSPPGPCPNPQDRWLPYAPSPPRARAPGLQSPGPSCVCACQAAGSRPLHKAFFVCPQRPQPPGLVA